VIEYVEAVEDEQDLQGADTTPVVPPNRARRLQIHGQFVVLATALIDGRERPVASGLLSDDAASGLASLARAARWEGMTPLLGTGRRRAVLTFDTPPERVHLRLDVEPRDDGTNQRRGLDGAPGALVVALGDLLDAAFARLHKGVEGFRVRLGDPHDTIPPP
jgi:hypothetical protein